MPDHIRQRIALVRKLVKEGLHQENLDKLVAECSALSQDTSCVLTFFVLKHVFAEISAVLEGEAVTALRHQDLTSDIAEASIPLLDKIEKREQIEAEELEAILRNHIRNVNVFRAER